MEIEKIFKYLLILGKNSLVEDIDKYKAINPDTCEYKEKNYYFNRANNIGLLFLSQEVPQQHQMAERYFITLESMIDEYEKKGCRFNKGMIYGNIGVTKLVQGEYDRGLAYLLRGYNEDRRFYATDKKHELAFIDGPLYQQFEAPITRYLTSLLSSSGISANPDFIKDFLFNFRLEDRLLFIALARGVKVNMELLNKGFEDKHTKGRIFTSLSSLCYMIEHAARLRNSSASNFFNILENILQSKERAQFQALAGGMIDLSNFDSRLQAILAEVNINIKRFACVTLFRNFSHHNFDVTSQCFFQNVDSIQKLIFETFFYLKNSSEI